MAAVVNGKNISTAAKTCKNLIDISRSTSKVSTFLSCIDLCVNICTLVKECYVVLQDFSSDDKDDVMQKVKSLQESLEKIEQIANENEIKFIHSKLEKAKKMLEELENYSKIKWYKRLWSFKNPKDDFNSIKDIINLVI